METPSLYQFLSIMVKTKFETDDFPFFIIDGLVVALETIKQNYFLIIGWNKILNLRLALHFIFLFSSFSTLIYFKSSFQCH